MHLKTVKAEKKTKPDNGQTDKTKPGFRIGSIRKLVYMFI